MQSVEIEPLTPLDWCLINEIGDEVARARSLFQPIYSSHEGLAIIWEEFSEVKDEVFALNLTKGRDTRPQMRTELIQLAAMAMRMIMDLKLGENVETNSADSK